MTILSTARAASKFIGITPPDALVASTSRQYVELTAVANTVASRIAAGHDWQLLRKVATITGDGTTEDFDLPSDYDRMLVNTNLWSNQYNGRFEHIADSDRWLGLQVQLVDLVLNSWTIYGGQLHIKPAPTSGEVISYFYMSNLIVVPQSSVVYKTEFTVDTDSFRLSEKLLELGIIWQWKESKGLPYNEAMENYEDLKERLIVRDKGSKIIRVGAQRMMSGASVAYPWSLPT